MSDKSPKDAKYVDLVEAMLGWAKDQEDWSAEDYALYIRHFHFIAQKAKSRTYMDKAMADYDRAIRKIADRRGMSGFIRDPDAAMDHFSVENTWAAYHQRTAEAGGQRSGGGGGGGPPRPNHHPGGGYQQGKGGGKAACSKHNFSQEGCRDRACRLAHKCSVCGKTSHKEPDCWHKEKGQGQGQAQARRE